jgi:RNA polymerase sigma factor (TIGR02999 family)
MTENAPKSSSVKGRQHAASEQLLALVYDELRKLAAHKLAHEKPGQTLEPTALVHEAYLRLLGQAGAQHWDNQGHFFAAAAKAMRRILIEKAIRKKRIKHGGCRKRLDFDKIKMQLDAGASDFPGEELLALDEALLKLAANDPEKEKLVELRFFAGLTITQAAKMLGISHATAERSWSFARVWLKSELLGPEDSNDSAENLPEL